MPDRTALYPGSFDPPTYGHLDLIQRALRIFDKVLIAVACNTAKDSLFSPAERIEMLQDLTADMPGAHVTSFTGLTAEFAREHGIRAIVRGLRAVSDFEFEMSMAITNQKLNPNVDTVCLMPSENLMFLSSRGVRDIAQFGGDLSPFVPPVVAKRLREQYSR